jgi:ATP-dependent DNA helicase RecQ
MNPQTTLLSPEAVLRQTFGYPAFRRGQREIIDHILSSRDVLAILPTGGGKSLCFQIPALILPGLTVVISPLISLMGDQVSALRLNGVPAAYINSTMEFSEIRTVLSAVRQSHIKLLYIAPERLLTPVFLDLAKNIQISMVCVDEAHCISVWGHDFRPNYRDISVFVRELPYRPTVSAFTATATRNVKQDIVDLLELQEPFQIETGFDRPNLYFEIRRPKNKREELLKILGNYQGKSGIIYCSTRKDTEEICEFLNLNGVRAGKYHVGLLAEEREANQQDFIFDRVQIITATNAFGMGVDKSDVRFVIHYNIPMSLENFYQEAGRAGRECAAHPGANPPTAFCSLRAKILKRANGLSNTRMLRICRKFCAVTCPRIRQDSFKNWRK